MRACSCACPCTCECARVRACVRAREHLRVFNLLFFPFFPNILTMGLLKGTNFTLSVNYLSSLEKRVSMLFSNTSCKCVKSYMEN